jgi:hypothetical protein
MDPARCQQIVYMQQVYHHYSTLRTIARLTGVAHLRWTWHIPSGRNLRGFHGLDRMVTLQMLVPYSIDVKRRVLTTEIPLIPPGYHTYATPAIAIAIVALIFLGIQTFSRHHQRPTSTSTVLPPKPPRGTGRALSLLTTFART